MTDDLLSRPLRVVGMMCGTSYDAIDASAADIHIDGTTLVVKPLGLVSGTYSEELKQQLHDQMPPRPSSFQDVCELDTGIGQAFAETAAQAIDELCGGKADVIASHGQTIYHWVENDGGQVRVRGTLQIGQPAWITERTGCTVVSDFRPRDVAAGGQGAPLVSYIDQLWLGGREEKAVALNIGGIANVTVVDGENPVAFDTGPGNALIDAAVVANTGGAETYDADGGYAAAGTVHDDLLSAFLDEPYYAQPAPKTTGKELFTPEYLERKLGEAGLSLETVSVEDLCATVTSLTARTIADAVRGQGLEGGGVLIASGGGTKNPVLMRMLGGELPGVRLTTSDAEGFSSDQKEALCFAILGYLTMHGLPGTVASATGARRPSVLGSITPGDDAALLRRLGVAGAGEEVRLTGLRFE